MFYIKELCDFYTSKGPNYFITYDLKEKRLISLKINGQLTFDDFDKANKVMENKDRYTPLFNVDSEEFKYIKEDYLIINELDDVKFKSRKQFKTFLTENNLYDDWLNYFSLRVSRRVRDYIEQNGIDEADASEKQFDEINKELKKFMKSDYLATFKSEAAYVLPNLDSHDEEIFYYDIENNKLFIKMYYGFSARTLSSLLARLDETFINKGVFESIGNWISFEMDLDKKVNFNPYSVSNNVDYIYNSRGRSLNDTLPLSQAEIIISLLKTVNTYLEDVEYKEMVPNDDRHYYNLFSDEIEIEEDIQEDDILNGIFFYNFDLKYINSIDRYVPKKRKDSYEFQLFPKKDKAHEHLRGFYKPCGLIKNTRTGRISVLEPVESNDFNQLERLIPPLINYFKKNGYPKEITVPTFFDSIFFTFVIQNSKGIKFTFDEVNLEYEYEQGEFIEDEDMDDSYILA